MTTQAGIRFIHNNGAFGRKYLPETMGSGAVWFDADGDGWQDLLLVNSNSWPGQAGPQSLPALYRNTRGSTFADVTRGSGLDVPLYGIGAAAADYDNDGKMDVYITALGGNRLFRNLGAGKFADATKTAGVADGGFSTSALWFDYDSDGKVDLFVAHYVEWSIDKDLFCTLDGKNKSYCTPESYKGQSPSRFPQDHLEQPLVVLEQRSMGVAGNAWPAVSADGARPHLVPSHRCSPSAQRRCQRRPCRLARTHHADVGRAEILPQGSPHRCGVPTADLPGLKPAAILFRA